MLSDSGPEFTDDIEYRWPLMHQVTMKNLFSYGLAAMLALTLSGPAAAACFADYKAKRDNPLRLHYGVVKLPDAVCLDHELAEQEVADLIAAGHWKLLKVLKVFRTKGLDKRKDRAGKYFLRF